VAGGGAPVEDEGGHSGSNVFGEPPAQSIELNLTALMDILSNLLFFLLACFGATIVMGINATVPVQSADKNDVAATKQTVTATLSVGAQGFDVTFSGQSQSADELEKLHRKFPLKDGELDFAALTAHLLSVKEKYPRSDTMILASESGTKYDAMIKTMDAAREAEVTVSGRSRIVPVFPTVVVAAGSK